ncbi:MULTISPECIES: hypothetical protein [Staphylococcus]|uniref:hypothetical protein n=1 Tax=Staphylococcus TaxID=1279 RepID=UPI0015FBF9D4|nr:hypothetical protein [Staphylococcus gallinarum]MCD8820519.1 hypothetical protein [Staphylococcus gallinarum]
MKINDNTKLKLSESSYQNYNIGRQISTPKGEFEVIEKRDDTKNGLRSYAFAPVVKGKVDTSHIYMGYAGTDFKSTRDLFTDLQLPF